MNLTDSRVLVTGATGFIGGGLAKRLVTVEGARVKALVRSPDKAEPLITLGVEVVAGDVTDRNSIRAALRDCQIVFHCAALIHDAKVTLDGFREVNVEGTRNMLEAAAEIGVDRFIHLSSIGVYGANPLRGTRETDPHQPCGDPYCDSKIEAEQVVLRIAEEKNIPVVIIRPANVYGPRSAFWTVALLEMIKAGQLKLIDGGSGMSNHVYIDNVIDAIILAASSDRACGEAFIIGDGANTPWKEFLGYYTEMLGREPLSSMSMSRAWLTGIICEGASKLTGRPPNLSRRIVAFWTQQGTFSITKARTKLGYRPRVTLEEGMSRTKAWLRATGHLN